MRRTLLTLALLAFVTPAFAQSEADTLASLQGELVRTAGTIRTIERKLGELDTHLAALGEKQKALEADYDARRAKMAAMGSALTRMGRTPREAVLIRPGGPLQAARTSMLLNAALPVVEAEAQSYRDLLTDLQKTKSALAKTSAEAKTTREQLKANHRALTALLERRQNSGGGIVWQDEARKIAALSRAARNLSDLLSRLDTGGEARAQQDAFFASLPDDEGTLPVSGVIRVGYGQKNDIGAVSEGITIDTLPGSLVVAPLGGIVRYVGTFRGYGNIVIIAHKGGFYSLLAGMDKINVSEGQAIVSGEPIAILDDAVPANLTGAPPRKSVYYELRRGRQAVNPSQKLPGLG
ncbi:MAG: peptidoglycan DD-metalloendopeptidase family protein [Alphaproteobacteria bacterium]|nr:peptidoglycan DD-metalloendopeptidase family protein [Alphaproteobacteria bacterium]